MKYDQRVRRLAIWLFSVAAWLCLVRGPLEAATLAEKDRDALAQKADASYDVANSGWGTGRKYVDTAAMEWSFALYDSGNQLAMTKVRRTLDANQKLIDPVWGGVFQYSDTVDWKSPHYEKLMSSQADGLRMYSEAYSRWHRKTDEQAAQKIYSYLTTFLSAPDGGFYAGQDADVSANMKGAEYYAKDDAGRRAAGMPKIDTHEYSRETGWAIRALSKYYDVMGDTTALSRAEKGAKWALSTRQLAGGGFSHDGSKGPPALDDNIAMAQAFLALYRSTGNREWLKCATATIGFIDSKLRDPSGGYGRDVAQNVALVRTANMLHHYTANKHHLEIANHAMKYLAAFAATANDQFRPDILVANQELSADPVHITVVGGKDDPAAQSLHAAALQYPTDYLQVDWWDKREGRLPDPSITYPSLERAAAFACTANVCSTPVYESSQVQDLVRSVLN